MSIVMAICRMAAWSNEWIKHIYDVKYLFASYCFSDDFFLSLFLCPRFKGSHSRSKGHGQGQILQMLKMNRKVTWMLLKGQN